MKLNDVSVSLDSTTLNSFKELSLASHKLSSQWNGINLGAEQALSSLRATVSPMAESLSKLQQDYASMMSSNINIDNLLSGAESMSESVVGASSLMGEALGNYRDALNTKISDTNFGGLISQTELFKQGGSLY